MRPSLHGGLEPKDGRILWMRDKAQFPVIHCKMTETVMQANCGSGNEVGPWKVTAIEKLIPISPRDCLNISESKKGDPVRPYDDSDNKWYRNEDPGGAS